MENLIVLNDVALPSDLLEATEKVVKAGKAKSINDLIAKALRRELAASNLSPQRNAPCCLSD